MNRLRKITDDELYIEIEKLSVDELNKIANMCAAIVMNRTCKLFDCVDKKDMKYY